MKKLLTILFLLVYVSKATGISANIHLCGGMISSISFKSDPDIDCCCNKIKCKSCKDHKIIFKNHDVHNRTNAHFKFRINFPYSIEYDFNTQLDIEKCSALTTHSVNVPPLIRTNNIYIYNMVFRV